MPEQPKSPILHLSQKKLTEMFESGEMQIPRTKEEQSLIASETKAWETFLGKKLKEPVPHPPKELLKTMEKAKEIGWVEAEAHYLPKLELKQGTDIPGWKVRPEDWYWEIIRDGGIANNAADLEEKWIIIDGSVKPEFRHGSIQLYPKDPFGDILRKLRDQKKIEVIERYKDIPPSSRFCISPQELESSVFPAIAQLVGVSSTQVRLPKAIEFNILGNIFHPVWGHEDIDEWFADIFDLTTHLNGGKSDRGGLAHVSHNTSDFQSGIIGFRPLIEFPPDSSK